MKLQIMKTEQNLETSKSKRMKPIFWELMQHFDLYNKIYKVPCILDYKIALANITHRQKYWVFWLMTTLNNLIILYTTGLLINNSVSSSSKSNLPIMAIMVCHILLAVQVANAGQQYLMIRYPSDMSYIINEITKIYWDKNKSKKIKPRKPLEIYVLWTAWISSIFEAMFLLALIPFLLDVDPSYFLFKMLIPGSEFGYTFKFIRSILLAILGYHWDLSGVHIFFHLLSCCQMLTDILKELLISFEQSISDNLFVNFTFQKSITIYKQLYIIVNRLNIIIQLASSLIILAVTTWFVFSASCSIKYFGKVNLAFYMLLPGTAILVAGLMASFISCASRIHTLTIVFIENHKTSLTIRKSKLNSRVLKALKPFGVQVGGLLTLTKNSTFTLFSIWVDWTINLLLGLEWSK